VLAKASGGTFKFKALALEPHHKEGGVFVRFAYALDTPDAAATGADVRRALRAVEGAVRAAAAREGGVPSWYGFGRGGVWVVQGHPWREVGARAVLCCGGFGRGLICGWAGPQSVCVADRQGRV
jgi:hypothetical protein